MKNRISFSPAPYRHSILSLWTVVVVLLSLNWGAAGQHQTGSRKPLVLAHYMVCCSHLGHDATIEQLKNEMDEAQDRGIDGFVLNIGAWSAEPYYKKITERMYQAADQTRRQFKLALSLDGLPLEDSIDAIRLATVHRSQLLTDDRIFVSSFGGSAQWAVSVKEGARAQGIDIFFVPYLFYPLADRSALLGQPSRDTYVASKVLNDMPSLDGYFYFGAARSPDDLAKAFLTITRTVKGAQKFTMLGISPYYKGFGPRNSRVFESNGFQGMKEQWISAIRAAPEAVELVTWNDWAEATYLAPFGSASDQNVLNYHWGPLLSHSGFLDASRHFIEWFKSGIEPIIVRDQLFYFYRLHPRDSDGLINLRTGSLGKPYGWQALNDRIFFTAFLTRPTQILVSTKDREEAFEMQAGVSDFSVPMNLGSIQVQMIQNERVVATKLLEFEISSLAITGNFNYFSGNVTPLIADSSRPKDSEK
ncbi:Glycosyl hydrolase family 71 [Bradyrhizobium shewense]|uniref:Glycosyl hydrolase family 71 n=1 Tax=Bradyrhizobium shewense TaxID=1761772 RepID=A0A1C3VGW8_9BRAD|nr:endo-1,3-alpha-glucanase family glycosylhydrolase [Bradyrhizobium shewense]SCB26875.1 Glycosyl hydrolase family 71 [Bradyrhizobium shewense]